MTNHKNGLKTVAVVVAIVGVVFFLSADKKKKYATKIIQSGYYKSAYATLLTFEEPFLKEWFKAAKQKEESFVFNGQKYNTQGGKVAK